MKRVGQIFRETLVNRVKTGIENNQNVFVLSYSGLEGIAMSDFRKSLVSAGANVYVSKNSIARLALKDLKHDDLAEQIIGQTAFVWSNADSVEVAKILVNFAKECEQVVVQGGLLDGQILAKSQVKKLSDLPSRKVLLAQLLGTIQAPITRLLGAFNAKSRDLLSILKQYGEKKDKEEK